MLRKYFAAALTTLFFMAGQATATVPVHTLKVDLKPGIRAGLSSPSQFAVLVPHSVSTTTAGSWSVHGGLATWEYSVAVPTAVSMSFHAVRSGLPAGSELVVRGARTTTTYGHTSFHRGELWSRIQPGEALQLTLTVPVALRDKVALNITSLQAGYRSLGSGVSDHPYFRKLQGRVATAFGSSTCVTNYQCQVTAANTPPAQATAALVVGNLYQCTGTLINDVPGDNKPYMLTGRHCETGQLGGGNPGAAANITVYWDAVTACGSSLGSIYDPGIPMQTGAQTIVEQQDAWLIELDASPVVADAQLAGFDATGGAVQGGYTVHHAEGFDKQFVEWFGKADALQQTNVLTSTYVSNFWETVNSLGNIGPGASGSGLFDQNNHLVGSLSLGRTTSDPSGYGNCPLSPPLVNPNGINGVADFTSLAAVWSSTSDTTSTTGTATIQSVLDPANTGTRVVASAVVEFITLTSSIDTLSIGQPATLTWGATGATSCTAAGGTLGDGWAGSLSASGSLAVTESAAGYVTYALACSYSGNRTARTSVTVSWLGPTPIVELDAPSQVWTNAPVTLTWSSNYSPCSITGGSLALTNLPGSGTTVTTQSGTGVVDYALSCGPANESAGSVVGVSYVTPSLVFNANGTDRMIGVPFFLTWTTAATSCTPSGGAPNDGWGGTNFTGAAASSSSPTYLSVTTPGTYTYTLTCSAGPTTIQQSVTVTFENGPPYVTLSVNPTSVTFTGSPADYATVTWKTNLSSCSFDYPQAIYLQPDSNPYLSDGDQIAVPASSGVYPLTVNCTAPVSTGTLTAQASASLTVLPPAPPTAAVSFNPSTVVAGAPFSAGWSSTNSTGCTLSGGIPQQGWFDGEYEPAPSGSISETGVAGTFTFGISCPSIDPNSAPATAQATLTITALTDTLTTSATAITTGQTFTLTWSSVGATSCTASGGGADGAPWTGTLATSGSVTQTASVAGTFGYSIQCGADGVELPQSVSISVSAPTTTTGGGSGGGGGGGLGLPELALLSVLLLGRRRMGLRA